VSRYGRYQVAPRYTPGSPAQVDEGTALHVAKGEKEMFEASREGYMGERQKEIADRLGLERIVYTLHEGRGGFVKLVDIITEEQIEGKEAVALELAALGTSQVPRKQREALERAGAMAMFEAADFVGRREILRKCLDPRWVMEQVIGFRRIVHHGQEVAS